MAKVHPTAVVDREAQLADEVQVGPYSIIGRGVRIARGTRISAHVVIDGDTRIGENNIFYPFSVIGAHPQFKRQQEAVGGTLIIGDRNEVREHVTIHLGTARRATTIGSHNLLMVGSHVAHDVVLGSHVSLANGVQLAGHARVEDHATFGGLSAVAQYVRVGQGSFVAGGAMCEADVPPFVIVQGDRARVRALNRVGLERRGVPERSRRALEKAFRMLFRGEQPRAMALRDLSRDDPFVRVLADFLEEPPAPRS